MTGREKYEVYNAMYAQAAKLTEELECRAQAKGLEVYSVFVSVGKEETREFFVDVEVGGSPETYRRIRGLATAEKLDKLFR